MGDQIVHMMGRTTIIACDAVVTVPMMVTMASLKHPLD